MSSRQHTRDFWPAVTGFIVGACVLFALVFGIVVLTNARYAGEKPAAAAQ